jgi:hypothetical protein
MVQTDGPDGQLRNFAIAYTFALNGIEPLQILMPFPKWRFQALCFAMDSIKRSLRAGLDQSVSE